MLNTMDVVFPTSPLLLHTNPELLRQLLLPVLAYANNETAINFTDPYSPHQLGIYPIADATTKPQEPMPLENSGIMLFMLLVKRNVRSRTERAPVRRPLATAPPMVFFSESEARVVEVEAARPLDGREPQ